MAGPEPSWPGNRRTSTHQADPQGCRRGAERRKKCAVALRAGLIGLSVHIVVLPAVWAQQPPAEASYTRELSRINREAISKLTIEDASFRCLDEMVCVPSFASVSVRNNSDHVVRSIVFGWAFYEKDSRDKCPALYNSRHRERLLLRPGDTQSVKFTVTNAKPMDRGFRYCVGIESIDVGSAAPEAGQSR